MMGTTNRTADWNMRGLRILDRAENDYGEQRPNDYLWKKTRSK